jgi:hypothetical protein
MASAGRKDAYRPHMVAIIAAWIERGKVQGEPFDDGARPL